MGRVRARGTAAVALAAVLLASVACGGGDADGGAGGAKDTLVFGAASDPVALDGSFVTDGESFRPIRQIFDTLVIHQPGGSKVVGSLAEKWDTSADGKTWTFHLHDG